MDQQALRSLNFKTLRIANVERCREFFKTCADWTHADWMTATIGELGELANVLKKVKRGDLTIEEARPMLEKEIADVQAYLDLLAASLNIDLALATVNKFNEVSDRRNCHIKLQTE